MQHALAYQLDPRRVHNVERQGLSSRLRARVALIVGAEAVTGNFLAYVALQYVIPKKFKKDNTKAIITIGFLAVFVFMGVALVLSMATLSSANKEMSTLIEGNAEKASLAYQMRDVIRSRSAAITSLLKVNEPLERERIFDKLITKTSLQ